LDSVKFADYHLWANGRVRGKLMGLTQFVVHTAYHRSQIMSALRMMGKEVVGTDYLFYLSHLENTRQSLLGRYYHVLLEQVQALVHTDGVPVKQKAELLQKPVVSILLLN